MYFYNMIWTFFGPADLQINLNHLSNHSQGEHIFTVIILCAELAPQKTKPQTNERVMTQLKMCPKHGKKLQMVFPKLECSKLPWHFYIVITHRVKVIRVSFMTIMQVTLNRRFNSSNNLYTTQGQAKFVTCTERLMTWRKWNDRISNQRTKIRVMECI